MWCTHTSRVVAFWILLILLPSVFAPVARGEEVCMVTDHLGDWKSVGRRYAYIVQRIDHGSRRHYYFLYSNKWNLSDDQLDRLIDGSTQSEVRRSSYRETIFLSPLHADDFDFQPRKGRIPGLAGPGRLRFEEAKDGLCPKPLPTARRGAITAGPRNKRIH